LYKHSFVDKRLNWPSDKKELKETGPLMSTNSIFDSFRGEKRYMQWVSKLKG